MFALLGVTIIYSYHYFFLSQAFKSLLSTTKQKTASEPNKENNETAGNHATGA
jgi:hypothetical protein